MTHISKIHAPAPDLDQLRKTYARWQHALESEPQSVQQWIGDWDRTRREISTWQCLVELHFNQDTTNAEYKQDRERADRLRPQLMELDIELKKGLLKSPARDIIRDTFGSQSIHLWESEVLTFDPVIADDLVAEANLTATYNELIASAKFSFQGEDHSLSSIGQFLESSDRDVRHEADAIRWNWFEANRTRLDSIFDELVQLRHSMATKLGFENYIELGYRRMTRIGYDQHDVAKFRQAVRSQIVPVCQGLIERQANALQLSPDAIRHWDESIHDVAGNPRPSRDQSQLMQQAEAMFAKLGHGLDGFFRLLQSAELMDLGLRDGKAGGGFCIAFDSFGIPFIFANFNGTKGDVEVFTHEVGHAYQNYQSRQQPLIDYIWPTCEACEIHSMSLEFLTYSLMENFFGEDAERFRNIHLVQAIKFLPYGAAVDHFQHLVYAQPDATPQQRFEFWQEMERTYLPWRDYGELTHPAAGGRWQLQAHIYMDPFYYIDYVLAQTCALQFWAQAANDRSDALQRYAHLCTLGGSLPFGGLVDAAGLRNPFEEGCLNEVVEHVVRTLHA